MKETREQISNYLEGFSDDNLTEFYEVISHVLLTNADFQAAELGKSDDVISLIEEMTGKKVDFGYDDIISPEDLDVFCEIAQLSEKGKIPRKTMIRLISEVFSSDTLIEGLCLTAAVEDHNLAALCDIVGAPERFEVLFHDPVYKQRKAYMRLISDYTKAALNLYGVIHLGELIRLIKKYESYFRKASGYERDGGAYAQTLVFSPQWLCMYTAENLIGECVPDTGVSFEGLVVHPCFIEDLREENEDVFEYISGINDGMSDEEIDDFISGFDSEAYFRVIYDTAAEKERYSPRKKEFLKYAQEGYYEETSSEKKLRKLMEEKYISHFEKYASSKKKETAVCIDEFMQRVHYEISDHEKTGEEGSTEYLSNTFELLDEYSIIPHGEEALAEIIALISDAANNTRLWANNGHTPNEAAKMMSYDGRMPTIIPQSSDAAALLDESLPELDDMGFNVDFEAGTQKLNTIKFPEGINGPAESATRKIYPNDPCPCGSGRKFKQCCGRK